MKDAWPLYRLLATAVILLILGAGNMKNAAAQDYLTSFFGTYNVTFAGHVGAPPEATTSIISGTTTGVAPFSQGGTVILGPSEPGIIAVPEGEVIPGVAPDDVIFGAAVMQNPLDVFIGTTGGSEAGDFGLHSMLRIAVPSGGDSQLFYSGCSGSGAFSCLPMFYRPTSSSSGSVNLIYFIHQVSGEGDVLTIRGTLMDRHAAEAATANLFMVPIDSPIMGRTNDHFAFDRGAFFELTISGRDIRGTVRGAGASVAGFVPQHATFEATFQGRKR